MNPKVIKMLKKSAMLTFLGYSYREYRTKKQMLKYKEHKVKRDKVLFATMQGHYNDSCMPIAEYMHDNYPEVELVWACKNKDNLNELPDYVRPIFFESEEYYKEMATASVWVFNFLVPQGTIKKDEQMYVQVWHGDKTLKKIGNDAVDNKGYQKKHKGRRYAENDLCDLFVTSSASFIPVWEKSYGYSGSVLTSGLPRNDILMINDKKKSDNIRKKIHVPNDVMILMYAPTFRDHNIDGGKVDSNIKIDEVLRTLEQKYGKKWMCLMRAHSGNGIQLEQTDVNENNIDVTKYPDLTELLLISDMLITDYSSCAGDFALTGKPVLLYQDDYEQYISKDRSLRFKMEETPFWVAHNMEELIHIIKRFSDDEAKNNCQEILKFYQSTQTEHATADVCVKILEHIKQQ